jgi:hypothetical protein
MVNGQYMHASATEHFNLYISKFEFISMRVAINKQVSIT